MEFNRIEKENIMIVDDVKTNLLAMTEMIRDAGYIPRPVSNVRHAIMAVEAELPDLIILDITMPYINGYDYCRMLKKDVRTRDIPVIFISALSTAQDRIKSFECGGSDYLSKPVDKSEVLLRVDMHLRMYRLQQELAWANKKLYSIVAGQLSQLENERRKMVGALAKITESRDEESGLHLDNISGNCRLIAMGLSLTRRYEKHISSDFIEMIETASKLHDIGKIGLPDTVLKKSVEVDDRDKRIIISHTERGVEILRSIYSENNENGMIRMAMDIAYCHHEKWDGTGYPRGLKGAEIPLAARIMTIVDVYDALMTAHCYKPPISHEAALDIIKNASGIFFDPELTEIFLRLGKQLKRPQYAPEELAGNLNDAQLLEAMQGRR